MIFKGFSDMTDMIDIHELKPCHSKTIFIPLYCSLKMANLLRLSGGWQKPDLETS